MDRIQSLALQFKTKPDEKTLARIAEFKGEFSDRDPVTDTDNIAWFPNLTEAQLIEMSALADPQYGLEQRFSAETGELDEKGDTKFEPVTKETFKQHKETLMTADKASAIMTARRPAEEKLGDMGKEPVEDEPIEKGK